MFRFDSWYDYTFKFINKYRRMQEVRVEQTLREQKTEKDVGKLGVWSVSSAKPGNGTITLMIADIEYY